MFWLEGLYSKVWQKLEGFLQYPVCARSGRQKFASQERGILVDRSQLLSTARSNVVDLGRGNLGVPLLLMVMLAMMMLPVPPFLLDVFFTFNIALSIVVLLVCVYALRPLDFAVFPTILLVATLLRLALNVASTRVVMLHGQEGHAAAGKVIQAFGEVVIGGNYVVGIVVFAILMIINFVVVTKGAGRISEVSARFTLDAMPGKQMAIDADLNAGLIDQSQAKLRRLEVAQEAEFYGSMDGASKFVRGDAIAGLLILFINLIGGMAVGIFQHQMSFGDAGKVYALLTIGDGLVAQLPSLLLSTAAAIMVTRASGSEDMGKQISRQMFASPKALAVAAGLMAVMGLVPGMPHISFLSMAAVAAGGAYLFWKKQNVQKIQALQEVKRQQELLPSPARALETKELGWDDVTPIDMIGLEVGYRLIPLVDRNQGGQLLARIKGVRKKLSQDLGFLMPTVHIRDNLDLAPSAYRLTLMGVILAEAEIYPDRELAINPGQVYGSLNGITAKDPAFGLEAVWIEISQRAQAQSLGYTVVDASTVVATHLNQILYKHSSELIGHEEVQQLLQVLAKGSPKLAEELVPGVVSLSQLLKILQALLAEQVPVRDIRSIAEAIANNASKSQDTAAMVAAVRVGVSRAIVQSIVGTESELPVITLEPRLEQILLNSLQKAGQGSEEGVLLEPSMAEKLQRSLIEAAQRQEMQGQPVILLVAGPIRAMLSRFGRLAVPGLHVLAYQEIPDNKQVTIVATVGPNG
ncbi:flagellar biosynthesis protein FlhA [Pseudomonas sp. SJZ085]|nr:flagellar biosynthesis protein FlhA [Pseudomonas sp. SJZ075]TWC21767.1 flagellar biosynthesis protein FlhA [Pseudomonas sp. SJZ074]TWC32182.1 flagellar biosynthesis protein FlhA [Pseudomonas sp. SJZ078]TWC39359.1 flagellar biosynthesis protein FlhA [Pseudomonas sp. SJZ085]TWC53315.1 flagellar biosynthesis protein FlhA [Pseudomonas sp. SJZ124]TWC87830.1 flagellar biosynthesis protein FlhA [Pseudomonas sp. SJZ101]